MSGHGMRSGPSAQVVAAAEWIASKLSDVPPESGAAYVVMTVVALAVKANRPGFVATLAAYMSADVRPGTVTPSSASLSRALGTIGISDSSYVPFFLVSIGDTVTADGVQVYP